MTKGLGRFPGDRLLFRAQALHSCSGSVLPELPILILFTERTVEWLESIGSSLVLPSM